MIPFVFCESACADRLYAWASDDPRAETTESDPVVVARLVVDSTQLERRGFNPVSDENAIRAIGARAVET